MSAISSFALAKCHGLVRSDTSAFDAQRLERFKRTGRVPDGFGSDMGVAGDRAQLGMAEQNLDHPHVDVRFQQL